MEQKVAGLTVSERAWTWFEANKKLVAWSAAILVVAGFAVSYYFWSQGENERRAGEELSSVMTRTLPGGNNASLADDYLKVATRYPRTAAGGRALLAAAGMFFTQGKYAEAQTHFQQLNRDYPQSPFRTQAQLGVAACLEALEKPDEAARAYKELIDRNPAAPVIPQAKFALARIHESQNQLAEAQRLYQEVATTAGFSAIGNEAGIKAEELRERLAALKPPTMTAPAPTIELPPTTTIVPAPGTNQ